MYWKFVTELNQRDPHSCDRFCPKAAALRAGLTISPAQGEARVIAGDRSATIHWKPLPS